MKDNNIFRTTIGGQALIEGILMRGPNKTCTVVRRADGELVYKEESYETRKGFAALPFIRGVVRLADSLSGGMKALTYSSEIAFDDIDEGDDDWLTRKLGKKRATEIATGIALFFGCAIPIVLFILLPTLLAGLLDRWIGSGFLRNLVEGLFRILIFFGFLFSISHMKDIRRTFMYHGAEHKTIHCYEHNLPLTVENVRKFPKAHPRCGTSFLFVVMIISILVFSFVKWSNPLIRVVLRLALLPVIVSLSYEFNMLVGRHDNVLTRILRAPGLFMQKFTTFEPDDSMIEVAAAALERVIPEKEGEDRW